MKISYQYDKEKDIWCLLNKGRSSMNSQNSTKQYEQLVEFHGENPSKEKTSSFVDTYILDNKIDIKKYIDQYQKDWEIVAEEYKTKAEEIFGVSLPEDVTAYLTINSRCPYNVAGNYFFVTVPTSLHVARRITMHELWHFYTWYRFSADQVEKIGAERYNDLKEALTVLLNIECKDILPPDMVDKGYPQHTNLRKKILDYWARDRNIINLWEHLIN